MGSTRVSGGNVSQVPVNTVGSSVFGRYNKISNERTYNMFISTNGAKPDSENFEAALVNFPGYQRVLNLLAGGPGEGRGYYNVIRGNFTIAVVNSFVYKITYGLVATTLGLIDTSAGEVYIADNLNGQVCIVDGKNAYIYNYLTPAGVQKQTGGVLGTGALIPNYVEYHNTFFLFGNANTTANGAFWYAYAYSAPTGATAIAQQTELALQTKADFALAVKRIPGASNNVIVFGSTVAEIWTNVGGLPNYIRNPTRNINYGCLSVATIAEGGDMMAWLATNADESPIIVAMINNQIEKISSDGIDYQLSNITVPGDSTAILYHVDGHLFYQLTFFNDADDLTLLYDFNTKMFYHLTDQNMNYHPARSMAYFNQGIYFLSLDTAAVYLLSSELTVINENVLGAANPDTTMIYTMQRHRITGHIRQANGARFRLNSLALTLEQGADPDYSELNKIALLSQYLITEVTMDNIVTEEGQQMIVEHPVPDSYSFSPNYGYAYPPYDGIFYQPRIDLSFSKDGGISWSNIVPHGLNPLGQYQNECHWENMGIANDICFKFSFIGNYRFIVFNALADLII